MRLAIFTQVADPNDPNLGVFFRWFTLLSTHFRKTTIVALSAGNIGEAPGNISFFSAGKERGRGRILRRLLFLVHSLRAVFRSDVIFVHMIPEYVLAVGWIAKLLGKRVYLWYAHGAVTWKLKLAHSIVDGVISSSPQGFRLPSKKATFVGQGIDTDLFRPGERKSSDSLRLITVGRISPAKGIHNMLLALGVLKERGTAFHFSVVGAPITKKDYAYEKALKESVREYSLSDSISFLGPVAPRNVARLLLEHDLFLNLSATGSLDKAVLEAMSAGLSVITANPAYRSLLPERYFLDRPSPKLLAERIEALRGEPHPVNHLREIVLRGHNLETTIEKIAARLKRQKLIYISPLRYPSDMAGSAFSMKSCEAFADQGMEVELWVPWRRNLKLAGEDPFAYHGVKRNFSIIRLPAIDIPIGKPFFYLLQATFGISVWLRSLFSGSNTIFYSHEEFSLMLLAATGRSTVYEMHDFMNDNAADRLFVRRVEKVISTNTWKRDKLMEVFGVPREKVFVTPNAVDLKDFMNTMCQGEARARLKLPENRVTAVYTGQLYGWKGVNTLIEASKLLLGVLVYIVGGTAAEIDKLKNAHGEISNVVFVGQRPHTEIPVWLAAADMLILPNTAKEEISKHYTSPVKLFEYMASGRPIIASDLPSIREVVDETVVHFFEPDSPEDLAAKMEEVMKNSESALAKAQNAKEAVKRYTWEARAASILKFLQG